MSTSLSRLGLNFPFDWNPVEDLEASIDAKVYLQMQGPRLFVLSQDSHPENHIKQEAPVCNQNCLFRRYPTSKSVWDDC